MAVLLLVFLSFLCLKTIHGNGGSYIYNSECEMGQRTKTLEFLFMASFGESLNSSGNAVGMMLAVDRINADSTVLPDYNLTYSSVVDSQCNRTTSLTRFMEAIQSPCRRLISVIGAGCSVATEPVAEISQYWGLTMVSYLSNSNDFRNSRDFPQFIQLFPSEANLAPSIAGSIMSFGWQQIAIITQSESLFITTRDNITEELLKFNISVLESATIDTQTDDVASIPNLFARNGHIFMVNTYEDKARQVLCEAYRRGLYGPNYLWVTFAWYSRNWWQMRTDPVVNQRCTVEEMDTIVNGSVSIQQLPFASGGNKTVIGNISFIEFLSEYYRTAAEYSYNNASTAHLAYDATWTLALALDKANRKLESEDLGECEGFEMGGNSSLGDWDYSRNSTVGCLVYNAMLETDFEGLSGVVRFDANGTRVDTPISISQYRQGQLVQVAVTQNNQVVYVDGETTERLFPGGVPPDGTPIVVITKYHPALTATVYVLAIIGLIFAAICFLFVIYFRREKVLVLSSNVLNYSIIVGVVLILISLFFRTFSTNNPTTVIVLCYMSLWMTNIGYVISFSAILAKMGRIYYIYHYPSKQKISINNLHLLSVVVVLTVVMVVILLVGSCVPYTRLETYLDDDLETPSTINDRDVIQNFQYYRCYRSTSALWLFVIFLYIGLLQFFGIVLVLQTRRVKIKVLNDSKSVSGIIYITSITMVVIVIVSFAFSSYQNGSEALLSLALVIASYCVLLFTFIPKMIDIYRKSDSEQMYEHKTKHSVVQLDKNGVIKIVEEKETIRLLNEEIAQLEAALQSKKTLNTIVETPSPTPDGYHDNSSPDTDDITTSNNTATTTNDKDTTPNNGDITTSAYCEATV